MPKSASDQDKGNSSPHNTRVTKTDHLLHLKKSRSRLNIKVSEFKKNTLRKKDDETSKVWRLFKAIAVGWILKPIAKTIIWIPLLILTPIVWPAFNLLRLIALIVALPPPYSLFYGDCWRQLFFGTW